MPKRSKKRGPITNVYVTQVPVGLLEFLLEIAPAEGVQKNDAAVVRFAMVQYAKALKREYKRRAEIEAAGKTKD